MARSAPARAAGAVALGAGIAALGAAAVASSRGRRIRARRRPELDRLALPPDTVRHHHLTTADGGSLHVVEQGTGRPVVLLHGVTLQWWVWNALFHTLGNRYRVVAWDMRGHGGSTAGTEGVTLEAVADDLALLLERLDLHDAVVVGHSMGGMALAEFCRLHHRMFGNRCSALMFLATSVAPVALPALVGGGAGLDNVVQRVATAGMRSPRLRYAWPDTPVTALVVRAAFGRAPSGEAVEAVRRMLSEVEPRTAAEAGRAIAEHDVRDDLGHVDLPSMVVVGDADLLTPPAHARGVAECVPGSDLRVLPGVGHQVMQEAPAELTALIDELAGRTAR